jgi:hypothetical protein
MDIGPVSAIRPVPSVCPSPPGFGSASDADPDLTGVFAAEFRNQQRDDSYSPSRNASRGLEDEDDGTDSEIAGHEPANESRAAVSERSISFFA